MVIKTSQKYKQQKTLNMYKSGQVNFNFLSLTDISRIWRLIHMN